MAVKYQDGNIQYTRVILPSFLTAGRLAKGSYTTNNGILTNKPGPFVNAIDIDWNDAYLPNLDSYITNTSDLLEQIDRIYQTLSNISENIDLSEYLKISDLPLSLTSDILKEKLDDIYASKSIEDILDNKANKEDIPTLNSFLDQLNEIYASKSIEQTLSELSNSLENKANKNEIPKYISDLLGYDNYATITWVNDQLRYYQKSPYDVYVELQNEQGAPVLSKEQWLNSLKGTDGVNGKSAYELARSYGITTITNEYDWVRSLQGSDGLSAFEIAKKFNPDLVDEQEWLASLKGEKGDQGDEGQSAFDIYKKLGGEIENESDWLASLKGEKGEMGPGINILGYYNTLEELKEATKDTINSIGDAYNVGGTFYVYNDEFGGNIDEKWKPAGSLKGDPGKSAFEIYRELGGEIDNETDWLASLKGEKGDPGKSAYDVYVEFQQSLGLEYLSKEEWLNSLGNNIKYSAGHRIQISEDNVISVVEKEVWATISD